MPFTVYQETGRLLIDVCRLHHTRADQFMDQIGLFRGQAFLLMNLSQQDGMTHSEIARRLKISPAAATKVIKRMEQAGYVLRQPDPTDERVSRVFLQEKGRALIDQINHAFGDLDQMMLDGLSGGDLEMLRSLLTRMHANLHKFEPESAHMEGIPA